MEVASYITLFVRTVKSGSFSAAARALDVTPSSVSRQIQRLEDQLGVRLLNRTSRKLTLTQEGETFYARCVRIAAQIEDAEAEIRALGEQISGRLRVAVTVAFGKAQLLPLIAGFLSAHPKLKMSLELTDRPIDFITDEIDVAVRLSEQVSSPNVIARRLVKNRRVLCASPAYLQMHGTPQSPEDLLQHNCLRLFTVPSFNAWEFDTEEGAHALDVGGNFEANSADAIYHATLGGMGISRLSTFLIEPDLRSGRLIRLFPDYVQESADILVVYPERRNLAPKVRAFVDFLAAEFAAGNYERKWTGYMGLQSAG
ncbi:MAG: LysR family transcriptional regulator [Gammaproteobacteria bacterium]|nr:LysR family transcriptional regulator [Gammaproteobacteria bacterium]